MRAHVLLCDHTQVENNKLFISGAGISWTSPGSPLSIAILIYVPWDRTNQRIPYRIELETSDGVAVELPAPDGGQIRLAIASEFEVGRPPGALKGAPLEVPLAINVGPLPLEPGRYVWRLHIGDQTSDDWTAAFTVRSLVPPGLS